MFKNLRLVVLDYPKLIIKDKTTKNVLGDIIQGKQLGFERASKEYVPMSALDMVSSHFLIYDTSDIFSPKLIVAIRNCYEDRAQKHNLPLPYEDYIQYASLEVQKKHAKFRKNKECIVDCNALFVDPNYSRSKTGLPLTEIAWFMAISHMLKRKMHHFVGFTNEKFKASRLIEPIGHFPKDMMFDHPKVKTPHLIILCEPFKFEWLNKCWNDYGDMYKNRIEYKPESSLSGEELLKDKELKSLIDRSKDTDLFSDEGDSVSGKPVAS